MAHCQTKDLKALVRGGVMGHAVGDALGVPVEFVKSREVLRKDPVREMRAGGRYDMPKGTWSDDTSMEIALMQSIIDQRKINGDDIMWNFYLWLYRGKFTATDEAFGTGRTCSEAISRFLDGLDLADCGGKSIKSNGNGSLMRILPVAYICYARQLTRAKQYRLTRKISALTHAHEISVLGCLIYVSIARRLMEGCGLMEAYAATQDDDYRLFSTESLDVYRRVLKHNIANFPQAEIASSGYVVDTLEAALWSVLNTKSYREAVETAVSLGKDTDTIAAVTGSLTGIYYGYEAIPPEWLADLRKRDYLLEICDKFAEVVPEMRI